MALLDRLGLAPKRARPVGQNLERGRSNDRQVARRNVLVKAGIFLVLIVLTLAAFPRTERYNYFVRPGDVWRQETLTAPFDFALYKDPGAVEAERKQIKSQVPPYFREVPGIRDQVEANRDTLGNQLDRIQRAYAAYRLNLARGRREAANRDSLRYLDLRRTARVKLTPEQWRILLNSYIQRVPELSSTPEQQPTGPPLSDRLLQEAYDISSQLLQTGVLDLSRDSIATQDLIVRNENDRTDRRVAKASVIGLDEAYQLAQNRFEHLHPNDLHAANLAYAFFRVLFQPSLEYMRSETLREWERQERRISPTAGVVREGEVVVREGEQVTENTVRKLRSLARVQEAEGGPGIFWRVSLGQLLLTLATYVLFFLYLYLLRRQIFDDNRQILLVALLFAGIIGLFAILIRLPSVAMYAVPVAIASILLTVMFDSRVGLFGTLTLALIGGHLLHYNFEFAFATLLAGALGVFSVRDIKNRGQFFVSAGLVFLGYLTVLVAGWLIEGTSTGALLSNLLLVGINSFLLIMAYPLLWVFERVFDVTTDLTLLELSDTNRPLLKELSLRAPGTFNHSLQVANLAEAAADAIGASALLTRVGALYHDIGKMLKPEYFVENQRPGDNPHDHLKPRMSALIIASHVKEGLEMGRQYNLPQRVLKFIPMHHGTTRIEYFYRKAMDMRGPDEPPVQETEFRYPGPQPDSKETGILMLADSVEAASRSLSEPTHKRLETLVEMIFKARIEDGQLDNTLLTFRDLNVIRETFLSMLVGIYHVRVKYPDQKEEEGPARPAASPRVVATGTSSETTEQVDDRSPVGDTGDMLREPNGSADLGPTPLEAQPVAEPPSETPAETHDPSQGRDDPEAGQGEEGDGAGDLDLDPARRAHNGDAFDANGEEIEGRPEDESQR
ncbi:MAG TPA: HDIG domain-containing protein [Rhodothermales bacterium]|nr:HDIG domain-containing protein [Rhodothermales bacterium]